MVSLHSDTGTCILDDPTRFVANARRHKRFLQQVHGIVVGQASLIRYTELWLPLVASKQRLQHTISKENDASSSDDGPSTPLHHREEDGHSTTTTTTTRMIPPPDIAWLWHCHRLAPLVYEKECRREFGILVEATPPFSLQRQQRDSDATTKTSTRKDGEESSVAEYTRIVWEDAYPNEPFFLSTYPRETENEECVEVATATRSLSTGFNLLESTQRQATFLWQISGPRFDDDAFLTEGIDRYRQFIQLKRQASESQIILVPTYQIDLMWHTHILTNLRDYHRDCVALSGGSRLHHDDSLTDRSDGGILDLSFAATRHLWLQTYGTDYVVPGGMYRGEPPPAYYAKDANDLYREEEEATARTVAAVSMYQQWAVEKVMGASSTSPPPVLAWANVSGLTSTGIPAFIPTGTSRKSELSTKEKRDGYVLGRTTNGVGYFHLETRDAHEILYKRVSTGVDRLQQKIACDNCCFMGGSGASGDAARLAEMSQVQMELLDRMGAMHPSGRAASKATNTANSNDNDKATQHRDRNDIWYDSGGAWLYPALLFDHAGGACGGDVACHGGSCGGSACGTNHHPSGAWGGDYAGGDGGGGCGGGGCGGGGCGGGGCGG